MAAAAARVVRRAHQPVRRCRGSSTPSSRSASSASREPVLLPHPWMVRAHRRAGRASSAPTSSCSTRRCRSGSSGRRCACRTTSCCTAPRSPCPGRLPGTKQALGTRAARRPPRRRRRRRTRPRGRARRRARRCRSPSCRPASTSSASARSSDDERGAARDRFGLPADAELIVGDLAGSCRARASTSAIRAAARAAPSPPRPRAGDRRRRPRRAAAAPPRRRARRPGALPRSRVANDDLPALYGCADVFTMLCRNRWGGLEQEGFGIVFVEAAACGVPQVAGDSGGAAEAVVDGVTGRRGAPPGRRRARWPRPSSDCSTTRRRRASMGGRVAAAGRRRVLLRRARRAPRASPWASDMSGRMSDGVHDRARGDRPRRHCVGTAVFIVIALAVAVSVADHRCAAVDRRRHCDGAVRRRRVHLPVGRTSTPSSAVATDDSRRRQPVPAHRRRRPRRRSAGRCAGAARRPGRRHRRRVDRRSPASTGRTASPDRRSPSAFLVPMFGFGLNGLWAASHGIVRAATSATRRHRQDREIGQNDEPWLRPRHETSPSPLRRSGCGRSPPTSSATRSGPRTSRTSSCGRATSSSRPIEVEFRASALGRSTHYTLALRLLAGARRAGVEDGQAATSSARSRAPTTSSPTTDGGTEVRYDLVIELVVAAARLRQAAGRGAHPQHGARAEGPRRVVSRPPLGIDVGGTKCLGVVARRRRRGRRERRRPTPHGAEALRRRRSPSWSTTLAGVTATHRRRRRARARHPRRRAHVVAEPARRHRLRRRRRA